MSEPASDPSVLRAPPFRSAVVPPVEKPRPAEAPSTPAAAGRYLLPGLRKRLTARLSDG